MVLGCKKVSKMAFNDNLMTTKNSCSDEKDVFLSNGINEHCLSFKRKMGIFERRPHVRLVRVRSEIERRMYHIERLT